MQGLSADMAAIARACIDASGIATAYFDSVPQGFTTPAIYFPVPVARAYGDTTAAFRLDFEWYVKIFGASSREALAYALDVQRAVMRARGRVPLLDDAGVLTGAFVRVREPEIREIDTGIAQLTIKWRARELYAVTPAQAIAHITTIINLEG